MVGPGAMAGLRIPSGPGGSSGKQVRPCAARCPDRSYLSKVTLGQAYRQQVHDHLMRANTVSSVSRIVQPLYTLLFSLYTNDYVLRFSLPQISVSEL